MNGRRVFKESDFGWLRILNCLKNTGMPLKEIRRYMELCGQGDESLEARQEIILRQKKAIEEQIAFLQENLRQIEYKAWYYETAIAAGTERIHAERPCNPTMKPDEIPEK